MQSFLLTYTHDINLADLDVDLSNVMSTSQINLSLSVAHELGKNTFLSDKPT